ncbi:Uncharacterised protein [Mycobacteroides abscessus subsp. abscessus]|uniref:hypothetical protein n=1 Tax=Mycobacteroides abscessus TaxID=36809 RepID=UPI00092BB008|nr:hypothetical protein [Mycobacteroides abscessus]SHU63845.1 Uncharacterised protein [Mycobacteroides abscessus subsp. abscessus]
MANSLLADLLETRPQWSGTVWVLYIISASLLALAVVAATVAAFDFLRRGQTEHCYAGAAAGLAILLVFGYCLYQVFHLSPMWIIAVALSVIFWLPTSVIAILLAADIRRRYAWVIAAVAIVITTVLALAVDTADRFQSDSATIHLPAVNNGIPAGFRPVT